MSRVAPLAMAVAMAAAMVLVMFNTDDVKTSAILAVRAALAAVIVGLSIAFGVGAADGTVSSGRRIRSLVDALPASARFRFACRRIGSLALGAFAGMMLGCLVALVVAWSAGSPPSLQAFVNLPVGWACVSAFAALGWGLGILAKSWFLPPVLTVLPFAAIVGSVGVSRAFIEVFEGSGTIAVVNLPSPDIYFGSLGSYFTVGSLGLALAFGWAHRWSPQAVAASVVAAVTLVTMGLVMGVVHETSRLFVGVDASSWPCAEVSGTGTAACMPVDQQRDLAAVAADLARYHERVVQVDPTLAERHWSPLDEPPGSVLSYELPLGHPATEVDQAPVIAIGLSSRQCLDKAPTSAEVMDAVDALQSWIAPWADRSGKPATLAEAQAAYRYLQGCP